MHMDLSKLYIYTHTHSYVYKLQRVLKKVIFSGFSLKYFDFFPQKTPLCVMESAEKSIYRCF